MNIGINNEEKNASQKEVLLMKWNSNHVKIDKYIHTNASTPKKMWMKLNISDSLVIFSLRLSLSPSISVCASYSIILSFCVLLSFWRMLGRERRHSEKRDIKGPFQPEWFRLIRPLNGWYFVFRFGSFQTFNILPEAYTIIFFVLFFSSHSPYQLFKSFQKVENAFRNHNRDLLLLNNEMKYTSEVYRVYRNTYAYNINTHTEITNKHTHMPTNKQTPNSTKRNILLCYMAKISSSWLYFCIWCAREWTQ